MGVDPDQVDAHRFRHPVAQAAQPLRADQERVGLLRQAFGLWRGQPLAGLPGPWATRARAAGISNGCRPPVVWAGAKHAWARSTGRSRR